jgi:hypothetical protein
MFDDIFASDEQAGQKSQSKASVSGKAFYEEGERSHVALFKDFLARAKANEFSDFAGFYRALQQAAWQFSAEFARQSWRNAKRLGKQRPRSR